MVKVICEKCGKDCDKVSYFLTIEAISNYATCTKDVGDYTMGKKDAEMKLSYCQDCYAKLGLPNIYKVGKVFN